MKKEGMMNRAEMAEPKSGHKRPAHAAGVGNERKANVKAAQNGNPEDGNPLRGAVQELGKQHPIRHDDHGPHHHTDHHMRHKPMHRG